MDIDDISHAVKARQNVSCEVLGGLREAASNTYAMVTLDGSLFYVRDNKLCWWVWRWSSEVRASA